MPTAQITRQGDRLILRTPFALKDAVKNIPGRQWDKPNKVWTVPATTEAARACREALFHCHIEADEATIRLMQRAEETTVALANKHATDLPDFPGATSGWMHQRQAFHFAAPRDAAMFSMDMGTGKSKVVVGLADHHDAKLVVVLAPKKATRVWPSQFRQHSARDWVTCNDGGTGRNGRPRKNPTMRQRVAAAQAALETARLTRRPACIIFNYEAAYQGTCSEFLLGLPIDVLVLDESHKLKAAGGAWSRFAAKLRRKATRAYALTGTPMPHSAPDIYAQYRALDPGVFGTNFAQYKQRYFEMGGFEGREILGFRDAAAEAEHTRRFASMAYICESDDVLDLPPEQDLPPHYFTLSPEARRTYEQMAGDFVAFLEQATTADGEIPAVIADNALVKLLRLAQITSGHLPVDSDDEAVSRRIVEIDTGKAALLADTLGDIAADEPVVVFARFTHDLNKIREVVEGMGRRYGEISGRRNDGLTEDALMAPDIDVVGVQLAAGGVGIDLTRARYAIYYSLDFNLGNYLQSRARVHRPGQTRETFYITLLAENSIDEVVAHALAEREDVVTAIIRAAKEGGLT